MNGTIFEILTIQAGYLEYPKLEPKESEFLFSERYPSK
jgi:hypothetical protein